MLTSYSDDDALFSSIMAGASGYVLKEVGSGDLLGDIRRVSQGMSLLDPVLTQELFDRLRKDQEAESRLTVLTPQERRVLELIALGQSNRQIAEQLFLAEATVKNYVSSLLSKLGMRRRTEAAVYAAVLAERKATESRSRPRAPEPGGRPGPRSGDVDPPVVVERAEVDAGPAQQPLQAVTLGQRIGEPRGSLSMPMAVHSRSSMRSWSSSSARSSAMTWLGFHAVALAAAAGTAAGRRPARPARRRQLQRVHVGAQAAEQFAVHRHGDSKYVGLGERTRADTPVFNRAYPPYRAHERAARTTARPVPGCVRTCLPGPRTLPGIPRHCRLGTNGPAGFRP